LVGADKFSGGEKPGGMGFGCGVVSTIALEAIEFAHVLHNSASGGRVAFFFTVRHGEGTS